MTPQGVAVDFGTRLATADEIANLLGWLAVADRATKTFADDVQPGPFRFRGELRIEKDMAVPQFLTAMPAFLGLIRALFHRLEIRASRLFEAGFDFRS